MFTGGLTLALIAFMLGLGGWALLASGPPLWVIALAVLVYISAMGLGFLDRPPSAQMSQILQGSSFA